MHLEKWSGPYVPGEIDTYRSFAELAQNAAEGFDFTRTIIQRCSPVAVVAPHAGNMEPGTSELARAIAGSDFSLYLLESWKPLCDMTLHITSRSFDDPGCLGLVRAAHLAIGVHGCPGNDAKTLVGGLDIERRDRIIETLRQAGFSAEIDTIHFGRHRNNICNRGAAGRGIQLELTAGLRDLIPRDGINVSWSQPQWLQDYVALIRSALIAP